MPARAGGNVSLALEPVPAGIISCAWHRARGTDVASEIFSFYVTPALGQQDGPMATGRETGDSDCTLHIRRLRPNDTGPYTVAVRDPRAATATLDLTVHGESSRRHPPPSWPRSRPAPNPPGGRWPGVAAAPARGFPCPHPVPPPVAPVNH